MVVLAIVEVVVSAISTTFVLGLEVVVALVVVRMNEVEPVAAKLVEVVAVLGIKDESDEAKNVGTKLGE